MSEGDESHSVWYEVGPRSLARQPWYQYMNTNEDLSRNMEKFRPAKLPDLSSSEGNSLKRSRQADHYEGSSIGETPSAKRTSLGSNASHISSDSSNAAMGSLKRPCSSDENDDDDAPYIDRVRPVKRPSLETTESRSPESLFAKIQGSTNTFHSYPQVQRRCIHKVKTQCTLPSMSCCCACADKRAISDWYPGESTRYGVFGSGKRWQWYCPGCKKFWTRESARGRQLENPLALAEGHVALQVLIPERFQSIIFMKSTDLTVAKLKVEIARVLVCDISELVLEISGSNLDTLDLRMQESALKESPMLICRKQSIAEGGSDLMDGIQWS